MSKVYCGNLEWSINEDDIEKHMSKAGKITFSKIIREQSGYSRGWGIVEYETVENAEKAVNELNNSVLKGRNMLCKIDTKYKKDENKYTDEISVFVGNLPWDVSWGDLKNYFKKYDVTYSTIMKDKNGKSRGYGIVKFNSKENADLAIEEMNNSFINGRHISVRINKY